MKTLISFIAMLLCISLCAPLTPAQSSSDKRQDTQATNTIAQDVLIIVQQEQVRFTAQKAVAEMQLQVFDQAGELVYDSGAVTEPELTWALRQASGETVKSGLYAYTLSLKEEGAADARVRRGHFIVDRARERDGQTDRLWITSQNDSGVGTELTVARNEGVTIAGASAPSEHKSVRAAEGTAHNGEGTARNGESKPKKKNNAGMAELVSGTTGQIAKFISATDLGDSVMTELNGNIGIGTTAPQNLLHVGLGNSSIGASRVNAVVASNNTDAGIAIAQNRGVNVLLQASGAGGYIGTTSNHALVLRTNDQDRMAITPDGSIAIGTSQTLGVGLRLVHPYYGIRSEATVGTGVSGISTQGRGVAGSSTHDVGVFGYSKYYYAGYFLGDVHVDGRLTKASGSFKIDHPLDPANKYLSHSFVESPDMMNIYNGNVTTDAKGQAVVTLPDYFTALNRDYRYQLTVVGQFARAIVRRKIKDNRFVIKTDRPRVEVSWQVTGVRQDAYAEAHRIRVEEEKTGQERGTYLHPEAFGQPQEKGVTHARHSATTQQAEEETGKGITAAKRIATGQR